MASATNPAAATPLPPWRSLLRRALHRNRSRPYSRYAQLATIRPDGGPANRTIVFRGFLEAPAGLVFVTDSRSEKVEQILHQPQAELCWYFTQTREQFRLSGSLQLVTASLSPDLEPIRQQFWQNLSDQARIQFSWPSPGAPRAEASAFEVDPADAHDPPSTFALVLLRPNRVEHLELKGDPQNRTLYQQQDDQHWSQQAINP